MKHTIEKKFDIMVFTTTRSEIYKTLSYSLPSRKQTNKKAA